MATLPPSRTSTRTKPTSDTMYTFVIGGNYGAALEDGKKTSKPYKLTVKMNHELQRLGVLSVFKYSIAPKEMPKHYPDFSFLISHEILSAECSNPAALYRNLNLLTRDQLIQILDDEGMEIDTDLYNDAGSLLAAMEYYKVDKTNYLKNEEVNRERRGAEMNVERLIRESQATVGGDMLSQLSGI